MPEIHVRVKYQELTDAQLKGIKTLSKDSVARNGIDAWFEPKDDVTDEDITAICELHELIRVA